MAVSAAVLLAFAFLLGLGILIKIKRTMKITKSKRKVKLDVWKDDLPRNGLKNWDLSGSRLAGRRQRSLLIVGIGRFKRFANKTCFWMKKSWSEQNL